MASYYLVIFLALTLFHSISGIQVFFLSIIVAVVTALIVQPLRDKTQFLIDRFFFREKYDASLMLQRVSRTAAFVLDLDNLMELIMTEVISTLHIKRAAFFIRKKEVEEFELLAHRGQSASPSLNLAIDHPIVESLNALDRPLTKQRFNRHAAVQRSVG